METDEELLQKLAADGSIDYALWPRLLCTIVSRLETIVHNDFPIPNIPPPKPLQLAPLPALAPLLPSTANGAETAAVPGPTSDGPSSQEDTNKENTTPEAPPIAPSTTTTAISPSRANGSARAPTAAAVSSPTSSHTEGESTVLPVQVADMLNRIISTLTTSFAQYPPHTIQRVAELILTPRRHYRSLTAYLHAVDRVTSVTSGSNVYPLPPAVPDMSAMSLLANGILYGSSAAAATNGDTLADGALASLNVGSDEALGGALLTPIPWLRARTSSSADEHTEEGSSPPSSDNGDAAMGGTGTGADNNPGGLAANPAAGARSGSPLQPQQQPQSAGTQPSPAQRIEGHVRTESTETIDGPNGVGSIETVSVSVNGIPSHGAMPKAAALQQQQQQQQQLLLQQQQQQQQQSRGITQGELLRQEQKAGVVPVSQLARAAAAANPGGNGGGNFGNRYHGRSENEENEDGDARAAGSEGADEVMGDADAAQLASTAAAKEPEEEDEVPHARGPEEIGAADTGPQSGRHNIDMEAAVGRKAVPLPGAAAAVPVRQSNSNDEPVPSTEMGDDVEAAAMPETPKREAEEDLDASVPTKRWKETPEAEEKNPAEATLAAAESETAMAVDPKQESGGGS